ncbi:protein wings apart-like isoform X2 [Cylas formicarius]|uniref:protein wings apart-like isoform X2 n=1 Tax=Cylas formicarius TaxID=197179 RepID=UPI0029588C9D|nr:protein wings apart-like isoform X2 [Cylas formicarius]
MPILVGKMSRGYGKYRRGSGTHSSLHFDSIFKENTNKPSAARSAATVGKWGITSFTSIRTLNGRSDTESSAASAESAAPKPKKFFKSRNSEPPDLSSTPSAYSPPPYHSKKARTAYEPGSERQTSPRKFFSSKNNLKTVNEPPKPPIVLRICHGKSQLLNDSDESESTLTPSTSTSPRALRESSSRPTNCRITRSARRSMQQDPSGSPATADTPAELSMFSDKNDSDLSPQYIPAEKYEQERRALYDNLLRPNSPEEEADTDAATEASVVDRDWRNEDATTEESEKPMDLEPPPPDEDKENVHAGARLENGDATAEEPLAATREEEEDEDEVPKKPTIEEEWSTDSDSNSTAPEMEVKQVVPEPERSVNQIERHKEQILDKILEKPPDPPPVKLVITKKKGSIFKSRALVEDGSKKRRARYVHKWIDDKDKVGGETPARPSVENEAIDGYEFKGEPLVRVPKVVDDDPDQEVASIKCAKSDKGYYMVVRNVKKAHQIQEIGEFQEFNDDVDYILDTLQDNNPISTRCLSAISLASKCMAPAFRMHVRAHGTVAKFFKALHDATKDQSLGLCTATVMFVLSQDRLNMDLDRDCLELMLNLLESDVSYKHALDVCGLSSGQLEKNKQKVRELCEEIQSKGHAMHLNLENITTGQLAMETLLSLTSKRAGEWFKEELRELGGLEHIMKTIYECCKQVSDYVVSWTDVLLDKLKKVDRCLRVLENVTQNNEENQNYILKYNDGMILDTLVNLYKLCDGEIPLYPVTDIQDKTSTGTIIREALLVTLKVLINLTHHFRQQSFGNQLIGSRPGIVDTSLHLLLQVPNYIPEQKKFELGVLVLMLLINLIQDHDGNKKLLMEAKAPSKQERLYSREESAVEALICQFYEWEGCAKIAESKTDAILDGEKDAEDAASAPTKSGEEFIEETVAKLLQKAGTHMEYTFLASYIVMLVGFLIMGNADYENNIRQFLRGSNFADMVELLNKFFKFMNLTASTEASSVCAIKATQRVIKFLEDCDKTGDETST